MTSLIKNYVEVINAMPRGNVPALLADVYAEDIEFNDPAHQVKGLSALSNYFSKLYENTNSCKFILHNSFGDQQQYALQWTMHLSHKNLKKGASVQVNGASILQFNDAQKISFHQDYFDLGEMLYENIPVVSKVVRFIKGKL